MVYISGGNELINPDIIFDQVGLKTGDQVADLGCGGVGHFIIPASHKIGPDGLAYAADILKSALQSVASRARLEGVNNLKTVWTNLEIPGATKIPAASLDIAFLINILFQSKQHDNIIQEAVRLLKPGGKLLVVDWQVEKSVNFGSPAIDRVKPKDIKDLANKNNLKLIKEFAAGPYHYGLIFQK